MDETLLIGIGAQKAGTTWLAEYLRDHQSSVHFTRVKEVHFFDNYCLPNYGSFFEGQRLAQFKAKVAKLTITSISDTEEIDVLNSQLLRFKAIQSPKHYIDFLNFGRTDQSILCDITPDYALLDASGFELMNSVHPNVKLVFILRNPADRFWSSLRFNHTHNPNFDIDENFDAMLVRQDFVRFANYDRTIRVAYKHFSEDNVYITFYENLFSDKTLSHFCDWLGVPFAKPDFSHRSNAALKQVLSEERRRQIVIAYQQTYREIENRFKGAIPKSWKQDIASYLVD